MSPSPDACTVALRHVINGGATTESHYRHTFPATAGHVEPPAATPPPDLVLRIRHEHTRHHVTPGDVYVTIIRLLLRHCRGLL